MVDVLDRDRTPLRRDPAGKALSKRNARASLDFLLDSSCGTGDELATLLVE
jgi:hypothetical protein